METRLKDKVKRSEKCKSPTVKKVDKSKGQKAEKSNSPRV